MFIRYKLICFYGQIGFCGQKPTAKVKKNYKICKFFSKKVSVFYSFKVDWRFFLVHLLLWRSFVFWFQVKDTFYLTQDRIWQEKPCRNPVAQKFLEAILDAGGSWDGNSLRRLCSEEEFEKAMTAFSMRNRRFGKV